MGVGNGRVGNCSVGAAMFSVVDTVCVGGGGVSVKY